MLSSSDSDGTVTSIHSGLHYSPEGRKGIVQERVVHDHGLLGKICSDGNLLASMKEGNVVFNNALNTFYLRLYAVRYSVKDHSDNYYYYYILPPVAVTLMTFMDSKY